MDNVLYANIGYIVVLCMKYIFIPFGVAVSSKILAEKLLQPQSRRQRKKRFIRNRFK